MGYMEVVRQFTRLVILFGLFTGVLIGKIFASSIHTKTLPANISLKPEERIDNMVYLEGESDKNKAADSISAPDKPITFYRTEVSAPEKYWGDYVAYDNSRFGAWGADKRNYKDKRIIWENIKAELKSGIYDVYVRVMITNQGSSTFRFKKGTDFKALKTAKFTLPVINKQQNITWKCLGSVNLKKGDDTFMLDISTRQTPIRVDTVILVYIPKKEDVPPKLKRMKSEKSVSDRPGGLVFSAEKAIVSYKLQNPRKLTSLQLTIKNFKGEIIRKDHNLKIIRLDDNNSRVDIALNKGYFILSLQGISENKNIIKAKTAVAVLGKAMSEEMRLKSSFGIFTVHGEKSLSRAIGSGWDRKFKSLFRIKKSELEQDIKKKILKI